jgi:hypothetical protein
MVPSSGFRERSGLKRSEIDGTASHWPDVVILTPVMQAEMVTPSCRRVTQTLKRGPGMLW